MQIHFRASELRNSFEIRRTLRQLESKLESGVYTKNSSTWKLTNNTVTLCKRVLFYAEVNGVEYLSLTPEETRVLGLETPEL